MQLNATTPFNSESLHACREISRAAGCEWRKMADFARERHLKRGILPFYTRSRDAPQTPFNPVKCERVFHGSFHGFWQFLPRVCQRISSARHRALSGVILLSCLRGKNVIKGDYSRTLPPGEGFWGKVERNDREGRDGTGLRASSEVSATHGSGLRRPANSDSGRVAERDGKSIDVYQSIFHINPPIFPQSLPFNFRFRPAIFGGRR